MRFVGILPLLLLLPVAAQDLNARLTQAQAISDVKNVVELLEASHPDPYISQGGKIEFKRAAQELVASIPAEGVTIRQLGDRLDPFLRRLRDGHTFLFYYTDKWRDPDSWLPVRFGLASDGLFLSAFDLKQLAGTQGWRVVGANGVALDQIAEMNARENGLENLYGALEKVASSLRSLKFMNNLFGGMTAQGSITYNLEAPDGRREDRTIPWSTRGAWDPDKALASTLRWTGLKPSAEMFSYQLFDDPPAAYLRIGTVMGREAYEMALQANPENGRSMLKDYYQQIKMPMPTDLKTAVAGVPSLYDTTAHLLEEMKRRSVNALVIDLRGNSGGWTDSAFPALQAIYGDALFAQPLPGTWVRVESALFLEKNAETFASRLKREPGFELGRYVFEKDDDRRPAAELRKERVADYLRHGYSFTPGLQALGGSAIYTPRKIAVLCDPGTFSAAFHLMMYLRAMGARIVGVPPRQSPNAFMEMTEFTLPESKLRGSISNSAQTFLPQDPHARVLQPDFPVTIDVYRRYGFDQETPLRYALDLLRTGRL